jgi:hypothetical protein
MTGVLCLSSFDRLLSWRSSIAWFRGFQAMNRGDTSLPTGSVTITAAFRELRPGVVEFSTQYQNLAFEVVRRGQRALAEYDVCHAQIAKSPQPQPLTKCDLDIGIVRIVGEQQAQGVVEGTVFQRLGNSLETPLG